jgi:hypothetical protein
MELVREGPPQGQRQHDESYSSLVVGEIAPHPLIYAFQELCKANPGKREIIREQFPMLESVGFRSDRYVDEDLWLNATEVERLIEEFQRLRRVCRREEFITHLDGPATYEAWRSSEQREEFEVWLDGIEALLRKAVASGYAIRLML